MRDEEKLSFEIVRNNLSTFEESRVVEVVKGRSRAERAVERWDHRLTQSERDAGWGHFLQRSRLKPGTDPKFATELMQLRKAQMRRMSERKPAAV